MIFGSRSDQGHRSLKYSPTVCAEDAACIGINAALRTVSPSDRVGPTDRHQKPIIRSVCRNCCKQAIAQLCAFHSLFAGPMSAIEILCQSTAQDIFYDRIAACGSDPARVTYGISERCAGVDFCDVADRQAQRMETDRKACADRRCSRAGRRLIVLRLDKV